MIITIDLSKETTPAKFAKMKGVNTNVVTNWMSRGKVTFRKIPELNLTLITIDSLIGTVKKQKS